MPTTNDKKKKTKMDINGDQWTPKKIVKDPGSLSMEMEDPINEKDPKSIEVVCDSGLGWK